MTTDEAMAPRNRRAGEALAMALYLICAATAGLRVFTDSSFLGAAFGVIVLGQIIWVTPTLLGARPWVGGLLTPLGLLAALILTHASGTFANGLPTARTWERLADLLAVAGSDFAVAVAPVPYAEGWPLAFGILICAVILGTQMLARPGRVLAPLAPGAVLFVFLSALGTGGPRPGVTLAVILSGYLLAATLRGPSPYSVPRLAVTGGTLALIGVLAVPYIPGAGEDPWVATRGRFGGGDDRISPLVDIQARLVEQSRVEMFTVESEVPTYWRMIALADFDGRRFTVPEEPLGDVGPREGRALRRTPRPVLLEQTVVIGALGDAILPAAATPIAAAQVEADTEPPRPVADSTLALRWHPEQAAVRKVEGELSPGDIFVIRSVVPTLRRSDMDQRPALRPPDPIYLSLPRDFPAAVTELAREVVGPALRARAPDAAAGTPLASLGSRSPFVVARTLQDWFRAEFDYSLEIPPGHGATAIEDFLTRRSGYCEQFAATFVAMARILGVPSRVAVGYTPGIAREPGVYSVQGRHAHAWPEVWFDDLGWVPFEPTPGRGLPGSEDHTGVAAAQDGSSSVTGSGASDDLGLDELAGLDDLEDLLGLDEAVTTGGLSDPASPLTGTTWTARIGGLLVQGGLLAAALGALAGPWWVRRRRARSLRRLSPAAQVLTMWDLSRQSLRAGGLLPARPQGVRSAGPDAVALTPAGVTRVVGSRRPALAEPLGVLAAQAQRLGFAPDSSVTPAELAACRNAMARISRHLRTRRSRPRRLLAYFAVWRDPQPGRSGT